LLKIYDLDITPQRKRTLKVVVGLSLVWFFIALPVQFLWIFPSLQQSEEYKTIVIIVALLSIPLAVRGILWIKKPMNSA
jgi:heme/copper-type cytochrome/quinol oxidase subunit 4